MKRLLALVTLSACSTDAPLTPDAPPPSPDAPPPTVLAAMVARGGWSEDFIWPGRTWVACAGCEHLITYAIAADRFELHVFDRTPGQPASIVEHCHATQHVTETPVAGFAPSQRTVLHFTILGTENTCAGGGTQTFDYIFEVVTRDASGTPTYIANWAANNNPAAPFPGYDFPALGVLATPLKPCAAAPAATCEPACDLTMLPAGGCTLPAP